MRTQRAGWSDLVDAYLSALRRQGRSAGSIKAYRWGLEDFSKFLDGEQPSAEDLGNWQDDLRERGLAPRSQQLAASAVRQALQWGERHDWAVRPGVWTALEPVRAPRLLPKPLAPKHLDRLVAYMAPRRPRAELQYWRDRALFFYLLTTGARISEALSIDQDDLASDAVTVWQKGGTQKVLFAPQSAMDAVVDYLAHREDGHPALWVTHRNPPVRRLSAAAVRENWHALADKVGVPRFHSHQLRHSCATELLDAGVAPEVVAAHLGHHGLASLAGYAEVRMGRRREAVDAMEARFGALRPTGQRFVAVKGGGGRRVNLA